jgi:hypothetical protein
VVSKVIARPRVNFIKSPYDDDLKAETCPADTATCRKKSYLVAGDLVLTGASRGPFTCVTYQSPQAKQPAWTTGWLPGTALTPVAPMPSPKPSDWTGTWSHPFGGIRISAGTGGKVRIEGVMLVPAGREMRNGVLQANTMPENDTIAFNDDGSIPFEKAEGDQCRVRMQRVAEWLMVEDNGGCGVHRALPAKEIGRRDGFAPKRNGGGVPQPGDPLAPAGPVQGGTIKSIALDADASPRRPDGATC